MNKELKLIKQRLQEKNLCTQNSAKLQDHLKKALDDDFISNAIEWIPPEIERVDQTLSLDTKGQIQVSRMDKLSNVHNHKKPVVAGLILKGLIDNSLNIDETKYLVDAGSMNTGFALKYYCKKFGLKGYYIMSRHFPNNMKSLLEDDDFTIETAPENENLGVEKEFYRYMFGKMKQRNFRKDKYCLWHAKYANQIAYLYGLDIAKKLKELPEVLICGIGAGTTLSSLIGIKDHLSKEYQHKSEIYVIEHALSPILSNKLPTQKPLKVSRLISNSEVMKNYSPSIYKNLFNNLDHSVLGPHYDELNSFITEDMIACIKKVIQFTDEEWKKTSYFLAKHELPIGNSSASNLHVALNTSDLGKKVYTVIYEPLRSFYLSEGKII